MISTITPDLKPAVTSTQIERIFGSVEDLKLTERNGMIYSDKLDQSFDGVIAATGVSLSAGQPGFYRIQPEGIHPHPGSYSNPEL